jgi:hypothetical protein
MYRSARGDIIIYLGDCNVHKAKIRLKYSQGEKMHRQLLSILV